MGQSRGGMYSREKHIYFDKKGQSRTTWFAHVTRLWKWCLSDGKRRQSCSFSLSEWAAADIQICNLIVKKDLQAIMKFFCLNLCLQSQLHHLDPRDDPQIHYLF
jgi:hypothetical protein